MANSSGQDIDQYLHSSHAAHRAIESVIMSFIFTIGAVGNPVTAFIVCRNKKLHNLHNSLTLNIILVDTLATFTIMPMQIYAFALGRWPFSANVCQMMGSLIILFSTCALWTILWLSVLRSLHINNSAKYLAMVQPKCMVSLTVSTWVVGLLCCSTLVGMNKIKYKVKFSACFFHFESIGRMSAFMIPFIVIPVTIISFLSIKIFRALKRRGSKLMSNQRQEERSMAYTYLMLVLIYDVCYFPVFIIEIWLSLFKSQHLPHFVYIIVTLLGYLPFSLKTVAYMLMKKSIRQKLVGLFKKPNVVTFANSSQAMHLEMQNATKIQEKNQCDKVKACQTLRSEAVA